MQYYTGCEMTDMELNALYGLFEKTPEFYSMAPKGRFNLLLLHEKIQLWVEPDPLDPVAAMVTEMHDTLRGRFIMVLAYVGRNHKTELKLFTAVKAWAQKNGCTSIRAVCKDAQARLFARDGFVKIANVIELELPNEVN